MKTQVTALIATAMIAFPLAGMADDHIEMQKERVENRADMRKETAEDAYRAAKMHCKELSGDAEDACIDDARAEYKSEKAAAKADEKSGKARLDAIEESNEAKYKAAKERCDELEGDAEDRCEAEAKLKFYQ